MNQQVASSVDSYELQFRNHLSQFAHGPAKSRQCKDIPCLIIFLLILAAIGGVAYYQYTQVKPFLSPAKSVTHLIGSLPAKNLFQKYIWRNVGLIIGMGFVSMLVSFLFLMLLQKFTRTVLIISYVIFLLALIAGFVITLYQRQYFTAAFTAFSIAVYVWFIYTFMRQFERALVLVKFTCQFLSRNVSVYAIPFVIGVLTIITSILIGVIVAIGKLQTHPSAGPSIFSFFMLAFFAIFFYYVLVYLIASTVANWFYMQSSISVCAGFPSVLNHLGSFTFASLIITAMKMIRFVVQQETKNSSNILCCLCLCLIQCFLVCIQALLQTLNHYGIIMMALTGQNFVNSVKSGAVVVFSEFPLFGIIQSIESSVSFIATLFNFLIPAAISYFIGKTLIEDPIQFSIFIAGTMIVSFIISNLFVSTFTESLSSIFMIFALENKLITYGIKSPPFTQMNFNTSDDVARADLANLSPKQLMDIGLPVMAKYANIE